MSDSTTPVGHVTGVLTLTITGGEPVELGTVRLPLVTARVSPPKAGHMSFGIGVDLDAVTNTIKEIFGQHEKPTPAGTQRKTTK